MMMPALSLIQPWAYAVLHLNKRFENRLWRLNNPWRKFRGTFLIHASKSCTKADQESYEDMIWTCDHYHLADSKTLLATPRFGNLERGGIVGIADAVGTVTDSDMNQRAKHVSQEWYSGPFAFVLDNVKPLPFTPCNGMLGFFNLDTTALGLDDAILSATHNRVTPGARAHV